jgi:uncharacterized membrane protein
MEAYGNKKQAQQRVDRIRAFREELAQLRGEGALDLTPLQQQSLDSHLGATLAALAARFDVDVTDSEKRISWGMRIASTIAGLALCAALVLFFYRIWGLLPTAAQVAFLVAAPLAGVAAMDFTARRERTLYYTSLFGAIAFAAAVLNLNALGAMFNLPDSPNAFLVWAVFGIALAYAYRLRLLLAAGLVSVVSFIGMSIMRWSGAEWAYVGPRTEAFLAGAALVVAAPAVLSRRRFAEFAWIYYMTGLAAAFLMFFLGSVDGTLSYLPFARRTVEFLYETAGLAAAALAMYFGVRRGYPGIVNLGASFFAVYLYVRLYQWWWDWMPKYLFFLIIGLISLGLLYSFQRLRKRAAHGRAE